MNDKDVKLVILIKKNLQVCCDVAAMDAEDIERQKAMDVWRGWSPPNGGQHIHFHSRWELDHVTPQKPKPPEKD